VLSYEFVSGHFLHSSAVDCFWVGILCCIAPYCSLVKMYVAYIVM